MAKIISGQLAVWKDKKGFGFIKPDHGGDDVFIHITAIQFASRRPFSGDVIHFQMEAEANGRFKAVNAMIEGATIASSRQGFPRMGWFLLIMVVVMGGYFYDQMVNDGAVQASLGALFANLVLGAVSA
jgi:cold shock CspA family protein